MNLPILARQALVTPEHFSRVFKEMTGTHVPEYLNMKRIVKARSLMSDPRCSIPYIADACGFRSASHFYRTFRKHFQMTPGEYVRKVAAGSIQDPT